MDAIQQTGSTLIAAEAAAKEGQSLLGLAFYTVFLLIILFALMSYAKKGLGVRVFKNPITRLFEQLYLFVESMCLNVIGEHGKKYIPMIMTIWMIIFAGNVMALFFGSSPTADLNFNLGMAMVSVGYVQWEGMRVNGPLGHLKHFAGPKLAWYFLPITLLLFMIELVSEVMKNVSLSLRLFGNIHGGHAAVSAMNHMGDAVFVPVGALVLFPIKILTCVVQALIFTVLTCVYLSMVTHHDEEGHEGHEGQPAHAH